MTTEQQSASDPLPLLPHLQLGVSGGSTEGLRNPKRGLAASLGLVLLASLTLCIGLSSQIHRVPLIDHLSSAIQLTQSKAEGPCKDAGRIMLSEPLHSNLGNHGPNSGDEGIVYKAKDVSSSEKFQDILLTINTSSAYQAAYSKFNGIHDEFGLITMKAGSEATFTVRALDLVTLKPKKLAKRAFTFFDLDQGDNDTSTEYIKVRGYSRYFLTSHTEIEVTPEGDEIKFLSSTRGDGSDNPESPVSLTPQQRNRAVTIEFLDFEEINVTLGCTAGKHSTYFIFAAMPSLLCAQVVGPMADTEDAVMSFKNPSSVVHTIATPSTTKYGSSASSIPALRQFFVVFGLCTLQLW
mmetsp:Transcript_87202/g.241831  ORF Transcript_87202/g.241831 Transcript_87202/m.241831 type:complete len:351 (-) Transcript_87202:70-1122(-)